MSDPIELMTCDQIKAASNVNYTEKQTDYEAYMATLTPAEKQELFARLDSCLSKDRPHGFVKFLKVLGDLGKLDFADAVEMANDGDTEN